MKTRELSDAAKPLISKGVNSPAVPQRSASLSYSTDDVAGGETSAAGGYTSVNGDSHSEMSENICELEIESDYETDMEGIRARVEKDKQTSV